MISIHKINVPSNRIESIKKACEELLEFYTSKNGEINYISCPLCVEAVNATNMGDACNNCAWVMFTKDRCTTYAENNSVSSSMNLRFHIKNNSRVRKNRIKQLRRWIAALERNAPLES